MIVATLLCIIALVGLIDGLLTWWGRYINIGPGQYDLTLELMLGYLFYPVAFLLGVSRDGDLLKVARPLDFSFVSFQSLSGQLCVVYLRVLIAGRCSYCYLSSHSHLFDNDLEYAKHRLPGTREGDLLYASV